MINQEEYEILKQLDNGLKWISRDKDSDIFTFEEKPYKRGGEWITAALWKDGSDFGHDYVDEVNLFQFIQWEDGEPYNIAELIEEYDKNQAYETIESEEKEVKKNKEWAQKEVDRYLSYEGVNEARNALVFAKGVINQLDEPEVLSQEWIDKNVVCVRGLGDIIEAEAVENLLVPKQELPEIPKYVADWIVDLKSKKINLLESIYDFTHGEDINDYMREQGDVLMRAWIDGFTVEKEQKYYAKIKGHELVNDSEDGYWNVDGNELYIDNIWHDYSGYKTTKLTKYDWNNLGINEDNADFVKVEEVE